MKFIFMTSAKDGRTVRKTECTWSKYVKTRRYMVFLRLKATKSTSWMGLQRNVRTRAYVRRKHIYSFGIHRSVSGSHFQIPTNS